RDPLRPRSRPDPPDGRDDVPARPDLRPLRGGVDRAGRPGARGPRDRRGPAVRAVLLLRPDRALRDAGARGLTAAGSRAPRDRRPARRPRRHPQAAGGHRGHGPPERVRHRAEPAGGGGVRDHRAAPAARRERARRGDRARALPRRPPRRRRDDHRLVPRRGGRADDPVRDVHRVRGPAERQRAAGRPDHLRGLGRRVHAELPAHPGAVPLPRARGRPGRGAPHPAAVRARERADEGERGDRPDPDRGSARGPAVQLLLLRPGALPAERGHPALHAPAAGAPPGAARPDLPGAGPLMGWLDALLGRSKPAKPRLDALFALPSAAVTLEAATGFAPTGRGSVSFRAAEGGAFARLEQEIRALLGEPELTRDAYGYTWLVLRAADLPTLVTDLHAVNSSLESAGFGPSLLCTVTGFTGPDG